MTVATKMRPSRLNTVEAPPIGSRNPATLWKAADVPIRAVVRNVGAVNLFVAHTSLELSKVGNTSGVWLIPPGQADIFVLAPEQGLYAAAAGATGRACVAISEALPIFLES